MTTTFMVDCGAATQGMDFFASATGGAWTVENDPDGIKRLKTINGSAGSKVGEAGQSGRITFHWRFSAIENVASKGQVLGLHGALTCMFLFCLGNTGNTLQLCKADDGTNYATGTTNVKTGELFRICVCWSVTSTTVNQFKVFLNGVQEMSIQNVTLTNATIDRLAFGDASFDPTITFYYERGIYAETDTSFTDSGDIRVTAKLPASLNTNNFDTLGGSGTNRYDRVSDRPLSLTNYIQHAAVSDVQENFGIQAASAGDVNIAEATLLANCAWISAKRGDLGTRVTNNSFGTNNKTAGTTLTISSANLGIDGVGQTVLLAFAMDGATGTVSATDDASTPNTYVVDVDKAAASPGSTNVRVCIIRGYIATLSSLTTITITHPSVTARSVVGKAVWGIVQSSPLDKSTSAVGTTANPSTGATGTTTQGNEFIFAALAYEGVNGDVTGASGMSPTTTRIGPFSASSTSGGGGASNTTAEASYAFQTTTGTQTASWTAAASDWACAIATYKSVGTGVGTPKLMNNGAETAVTLTTAAAIYTVITDSAAYPSNAAAIGMRSSNDEPDTFLYECGMLIAYKPYSFQPRHGFVMHSNSGVF